MNNKYVDSILLSQTYLTTSTMFVSYHVYSQIKKNMKYVFK